MKQETAGILIIFGQSGRIQRTQQRQGIFGFRLADQSPLLGITGQDNIIVIDAKINGIGKIVVHVQCVAGHLFLKQTGTDPCEKLFISAVCKEKYGQKKEGKKKNCRKQGLFRGNTSMGFHEGAFLILLLTSICQGQVSYEDMGKTGQISNFRKIE